MNCQHCRDIMFDYCEGGLSSAERNEIRLHLLGCDYCQRQFELTELEDQILKDTNDIPDINYAFNLNVLNMINAGDVSSQIITIERPPRIRWWQTFPKVGVAAVLFLACLYVPGILPDPQDKKPPEQATLVDNLFSPLSKAVHFDTTVNDESVTKQSTNHKNGTDTFMQAEKHKSENDIKSFSDQTLPSEVLLEAKILQSRPTSEDNNGKGTTTGSLPVVPDEASRSLKSNLRFVDIKNIDKPTLYNIPEGYVLTKTNDISENQIAYSYENATIQKSFIVNISTADPVVKITVGDVQTVNKSQDLKTVELDNIAALQNEAKRVIEYNGTAYQVAVTSTMSQEELNQIAGDISLNPPL